jgi:hypothetical protein
LITFRYFAILALLFLVFAVSPLAEAQIIYGSPPSINGQIIYQHWKLTSGNGGKDTILTQVVAPISAFVPIAPHWELHLNSALSRSKLDYGTTATNISSLGLTTLRVFHSFSEDRLFVAAGMILPMGKTGYTNSEAAIAQLIANDFLTLPLKQLGGGVGLILQVGGASQYKWLLYGGSIGYTYAGSYTYLKDGDHYNPGDEIVLQGSASAVGRTSSLDLDLSYKIYTADKIGSKQIFKAGGIVSAVLTGKYNFHNGMLSATLAEILRSKNSLQFGSALRSEDRQSNANKTILGGGIAYTFIPKWSFTMLTEYRLLTANKYEVTSEKYFGKSDLFSFGGGIEYRDPGDRFALTTRLILSSGEANKSAAQHPSISISAYELSIGGRIRL